MRQFGWGEIARRFQAFRRAIPKLDIDIDEIVDTVREFSQTRTGALLILETETNAPIDERDFAVPGVKLDALVSKELLKTIFQPRSPLSDEQ